MNCKSITIINVLILLLILTAGCITVPSQATPVENETSEFSNLFTPGIYDKGSYRTPPGVEGQIIFPVEWRFDLENSTGFAKVERRNATESRVPVFVANLSETGLISLKITAPAGKDIQVHLDPDTDVPNGMSVQLQQDTVNVSAGDTVFVYLEMNVDANATNTDAVSLILLSTEDGWKLGSWCQMLTSTDSHIPQL
ncbi:hypothetical protein [Methanorbis rubei]|uniref:Uncharacterized protein n=1 Tax=Methanorbis rubei TaxID=3028300 RepID=A0AAE4MEI9_9EURY|nr:hypothetical protein [Methanocorpusculaceae archaeon Cs1]